MTDLSSSGRPPEPASGSLVPSSERPGAGAVLPHHLVLDLTDEEMVALGYALGCGIDAALRDRKEAVHLRLLDLHRKIGVANDRAAAEASRV